MDAFCPKCSAPYREDDRFCGKCGVPRAEPATTATAATSTGRGMGMMITFGSVAVAAIAGFLVFGSSCEHVTGQVIVTGVPQRTFTFRPTGCASMQPFGHFGANLHGKGPNDGGIYVVVDPLQGTSVRVEIPGSCRNADGTMCTVFDVPHDQCRVFDVAVRGNGVEVNDVPEVKGHLGLDCALGDGTTVRGHVEFDGC